MEKGKIILMILALMGTASASSILMSNTSAEYEICVFDGSGLSYGCANTTHSVNFSRIDPIFFLKFTDEDYLKNPVKLVNLIPTLLYMGVFIIIAIMVSYFVAKIFIPKK